MHRKYSVPSELNIENGDYSPHKSYVDPLAKKSSVPVFKKLELEFE
jgi:hypothetical protein